MPMRMFVALDLPEQITGTLANLDPGLPGLRWLPANRMHLTLVFLAAVPEEKLAGLLESLAAIQHPAFSLGLQGLGCFARFGRPAVVWAGCENPPQSLIRLQRRVREAVHAAGLQPAKNRFRPHVTLGRCRDLSDSDLRPLLDACAHDVFGSFEAQTFTLFASVLQPGGPEYQVVLRQELGKERR